MWDGWMLSSDVAGVLQEAGDAYSRARTWRAYYNRNRPEPSRNRAELSRNRPGTDQNRAGTDQNQPEPTRYNVVLT